MSESEGLTWRSVFATFLWLLVTLGGLTLLLPILTISFGIGHALGVGEPTSVVADKYRIVSARYFGVFIYGAIWLAGIIALNPYFTRARSLAQLMLRFAWVAAVEAAVWGIGWGVEELLMT